MKDDRIGSFLFTKTYSLANRKEKGKEEGEDRETETENRLFD